MKKATRFLGLDVHAETIAVAIAEDGRDGEVRSVGVVSNEPAAIRKLIQKLGKEGLRACYEAGPTGYTLYWQLTELGVDCEVIAPTLVPQKAGDRVKTDRRDAIKLARCFRAGELTKVWVPDRAHEALRDLVRAREDAKQDQHRARQRLSKFLLRVGRRLPKGAWANARMEWIRVQTFEHVAQQATMVDYLSEVDHADERILRLEQAIDEAVKVASPTVKAVIEGLQALRGIAKLTATTIAVEVGSFSRFALAKRLMAFCGSTPSEHSTGNSRRLGGITKTGNAHVRRVLFEAAWCCRHRPSLSIALKKRQRGVSEEVKQIAWRAQHRLHKRYVAMTARGKPTQKVVGAIGRELLGFIWAVAVQVEREQQHLAVNQQLAA
jgi:transposase